MKQKKNPTNIKVNKNEMGKYSKTRIKALGAIISL